MQVKGVLREVVAVSRQVATDHVVDPEARVEACSVVLKAIELESSLSARQLDQEA